MKKNILLMSIPALALGGISLIHQQKNVETKAVEDFSTYTEITSLGGTLKAGNYILANDITVSDNIVCAWGSTIKICLNDKALNMNSHIFTSYNSNLYIMDNNPTTKRYFTDADDNKVFSTLEQGYDPSGKEVGTDYVTTLGGVIYNGYSDIDTNTSGCFYFMQEGSVSFDGINVVGCHASNAGGAVGNFKSTVSFSTTNSYFAGNRAAGAGGVIKIENSVENTFKNNVFEYNVGSTGGAISIETSVPSTIEGCTFHKNTAMYKDGLICDGGAIFNNSSANITLIDNLITENYARYGGAIRFENGFMTIKSGTFKNNIAERGDSIIKIGNYAKELYLFGGTITENKVTNGDYTYGGAITGRTGQSGSLLFPNGITFGGDFKIYNNTYIDNEGTISTGDYYIQEDHIGNSHTLFNFATGEDAPKEGMMITVETANEPKYLDISVESDEDYSKYFTSNNSLYKVISEKNEDTGKYILKLAKSYDVTLYKNDGTDAKIETKASKLDLSQYTFSSIRRVLTGWNTKADGSGTSYKLDDVITLNAETNLYAQWQNINTQFVGTEITYNTTTKTVSGTHSGSISGDTYLNTSTFDLFLYNGTNWTYLGNIKGEKGDKGDTGDKGAAGADGKDGKDGTNGTNGSTIYNGEGNPNTYYPTTGVVGDYFLDTTSSTLYIKVTDGESTAWSSLCSIKGQAGSKIYFGAGNPMITSMASQGVEGDYYIDTTTYDLYCKQNISFFVMWTQIGNIKGATPSIGTNGNWYIGTTDTGVKANGSDGKTPNIGTNGNWFIGETDTGVKAQGATGEDGDTPYIGTNGNWYIGETDTGIKAQGTKGDTGTAGTNGKDGTNLVPILVVSIIINVLAISAIGVSGTYIIKKKKQK